MSAVGGSAAGFGPPPIPRLIHWWWDGPPVPPEYVEFRRRWVELHPGWRMRVWDEASFLAEFDTAPGAQLYQQRGRYSPRAHEWGWKTNIARLVILRRLGGLWADADLEPLRPVDPLMDALDPVDGAALAFEDDRHVNNAFLAAAPGCPFITDAVDSLPQQLKANRGKPSTVATGPHYMTALVARHPEVTVLARELIYPMHWSELHRRCEDFAAAYTLHHWHRISRSREGVRRAAAPPR